MPDRSNPNTTHNYAGIPANTFIKSKASINSYEDASAFLGNEKEKRLASNVRLRRIPPFHGSKRIAVVLYQTEIIAYFEDGSFQFTNGGHNTPTTSCRCNQFGPARFFFFHDKKKLVARDHKTSREWKQGELVTTCQRKKSHA